MRANQQACLIVCYMVGFARITDFVQPTTTPRGIRGKRASRSLTENVTYSKPTEEISLPNVHLTYASVSKLYNDIMLTYDKKFRPFYGGKPVEVELDFHVLSFGNINEVEMEYEMDMYFAQIWHDPRFNVSGVSENATIELLGSQQLDDIWLPDTIFINSKSSNFHQITVENRFVTIYLWSGLMVYHSRITLTASCRMNLRKYPFDTQICYLAVESYGHDEYDTKFRWRVEEGCTEECDNIHIYDKDMANFDLTEAKKSATKTLYHTDKFSSATARFIFRRRQQFFVLRVFVPCILVVMVSWSSFWISQDAIPARSAIYITSILTLITMLGVVNSNMPKVSYIKALDMFLLISFVFVFFALVEYIIVLNSHFVMEYLQLSSCLFFRRKKNRHEEIDLMRYANQNDRRSSLSNRSPLKSYSQEEIEFDGQMGQFRPFENRNGYHNQRRGTLPLLDSEGKEESQGPIRRVSSPRLKIKQKKEDKELQELKELGKIKQPIHLVDYVSRLLFPVAYSIFNIIYWYNSFSSDT